MLLAAVRRMSPDVVGSAFAECAGDRELRAAFRRRLFDLPRDAVRETLERTFVRGDLRENVDLDLLLDLSDC